MSRPTSDADHAPGYTLAENFTRIIDLRWIEPGQVRAAREHLLGAEATIGQDRLPAWEPLPESDRDNQTRFFLDSVRRYMGGPDPGPDGVEPDTSARQCAALHWERELLSRFRRELEVKTDGHVRRLNLEDCEAYLFENGVVALVWEVSLPAVPGPNGDPPDLVTLAGVNHGLRYRDAARAATLRTREGAGPSWDGRAEESFLGDLGLEGTTLPGMAAEAFGPLRRRDIEVRDANDGAYKVQTFARLTGLDSVDGLGEELFLLRRAAKESFEVPADEARANGDHPDVLRTFDNVALGVSLEGMAMLVADTGHPFMKQLGHRARTSYFAHYLLALAQRASLHQLAVDAGRLPELPARSPDIRVIREVRRLRRRAIDFNLRHRFSQVSTVTMYDRLYRRLLDVLGIPRLVDEIRDEVQELDEILHTHVQRKQSRRARNLNYLLAGFGVLSLLLALFGGNLPLFADAWVEELGLTFYTTPQFLVPTLVGALLLLIVLGLAVRDQLQDPGGWGPRDER